VPGPISVEVVAQECETMLAEGRKLRGVADNIVVKLPLTPDGLKACKTLSAEGHPTNVTLCFFSGAGVVDRAAGLPA
jgi:transaldolase